MTELKPLLTQIYKIIDPQAQDLGNLVTESLHEIQMSTAEKLYEQKNMKFDISEESSEQQIMSILANNFSDEEIALASAEASFEYINDILSGLNLSEEQKSQLTQLFPKNNNG